MNVIDETYGRGETQFKESMRRRCWYKGCMKGVKVGSGYESRQEDGGGRSAISPHAPRGPDVWLMLGGWGSGVECCVVRGSEF